MVMFAMNITDVNCLGSLRQTSMALGVERHVILDSVKGYSRIEKDKAYTEYLESVDAKAWYLYLRGVG